MCQPKEEDRPTADKLLLSFPEGIVDQQDFEGDCLLSRIEYQRLKFLTPNAIRLKSEKNLSI